MHYLGLGKTKYNSSICLIQDSKVELLLTERFNKIKNSGAWPSQTLQKIKPLVDLKNLKIAENRDVIAASQIEILQDTHFPFFDYLKKKEIEYFSSHFNPQIQSLSHHLCHAYAALAMSPFSKSLIVVVDGAGSPVLNSLDKFEECTVYLQDGVKLNQIYSTFVQFTPSVNYPQQTFSNTIGFGFEKVSEFIFNSPHSSGKVMGLAPYGVPQYTSSDIQSFLEAIPWNDSFKGRTKEDWEMANNDLFKNLAASIQKKLEDYYDQLLDNLKIKYPEYDNLILTGGCALNCTNNARILYQKKFNQVYVPPFPGDESIGFGLAHYLKFKDKPESWEVNDLSKQSAYFGFSQSVPTDDEIEKVFNDGNYVLKKSSNIAHDVAELLRDDKIIAWYQGRSETGPRALGNRSILAKPNYCDLKKFLNHNVKFREDFRPYGCSVLQEKAHHYFDVPVGFDNPYMSYALRVKEEYKNELKEVSHIDGTSRMQTVRKNQNTKFYDLIKYFGDMTNLYCLLNTSLNVMGEPILETIEDAKRFMDRSVIKYIAIEDILIVKKDLKLND